MNGYDITRGAEETGRDDWQHDIERDALDAETKADHDLHEEQCNEPTKGELLAALRDIEHGAGLLLPLVSGSFADYVREVQRVAAAVTTRFRP